MLILALSQPFLGLHFTLGGALRGAGDTVTPFWAALIGNWAFRVPMAVVCAWVLEWSVVWVWFALSFDHVSRAVWMLWAFWRGEWAKNVGASTGSRP
jgi:Na+-driven multidrug efflux pump